MHTVLKGCNVINAINNVQIDDIAGNNVGFISFCVIGFVNKVTLPVAIQFRFHCMIIFFK